MFFMGISHKRDIVCHKGRRRRKRPKTFDSEEKAKSWALKQGTKDFDIVKMNAGLSRKFKIAVKQRLF